MSWNPERPYNELPPLPDPAQLESKVVLRQCIASRAAMAELRQGAELIPDAGMLINTLPVLEAQSSTEIENIVTTADRLFQHLHREATADPATKEALRYREALMEGARQIETLPISTRLAETVCSTIKGQRMKVRRVPGTTLADATTAAVIYTPPEGEDRLREMLADWERFLNEPSEVDPLIRLAAAHYQFEAIHPFTDGNGRTGRVLNSLVLVQEELLPMPILYMSRHLIRHRSEYYRHLLEVTRTQEWEGWLLFLLAAIEETARWTLERIVAVRGLAEHTADYVRKRLPKIYSRELVDVLFRQPYCRIANVVDAGVAQRETASRYLKKLANLDILEERRTGREKIFVHRTLLELLTKEETKFKRYG